MRQCSCLSPVRPCSMISLCSIVQPQGEDEGVHHGRITGPEIGVKVPDITYGGAKPMAAPKEPSAAEVERHMLTHLPYCALCKYCVAGRRPNAQHRRQKSERRCLSAHAITDVQTPWERLDNFSCGTHKAVRCLVCNGGGCKGWGRGRGQNYGLQHSKPCH